MRPRLPRELLLPQPVAPAAAADVVLTAHGEALVVGGSLDLGAVVPAAFLDIAVLLVSVVEEAPPDSVHEQLAAFSEAVESAPSKPAAAPSVASAALCAL